MSHFLLLLVNKQKKPSSCHFSSLQFQKKSEEAAYLASSTVKAGLVGALVGDPGLAVGASVAGRAAASVGALAGVEAGGPVAAGLVVGAVVEILVAEQAAPAVIAVALPGVLAGAMLAPGVPDALIAKGTSPSTAAPES